MAGCVDVSYLVLTSTLLLYHRLILWGRLSVKNQIKLLRAIFVVVISIALVQWSHFIGGGKNNLLSTVLIIIGGLLFWGGVFLGISVFPSQEVEETSEQKEE